MIESKRTGAFNTILMIVATAVFFAVMACLLEQRPMHHDEANQAYSARLLLSGQGYAFRPEDHHGPTLYYALLPVAWLRGCREASQLDVTTVRLVPLLFACGVLLLPLLLRRQLGEGSALMAALSLCVSPCFCYYSGYFVQEMLLVFFIGLTLLSGCRWWQEGGRGWTALTGIGLGLCIATKETWMVNAFAAAVGIIVLYCRYGRGAGHEKRQQMLKRLASRDVWILLGCTIGIWLLFYSSFFTNLRGLVDFFACWSGYFRRGTVESPHTKPIYQYVLWLFWWRVPLLPWWSEWLIGGGFLLGCVQLFVPSLRPNGLQESVLLFCVIYTLSLHFGYSLIPYKTPWCGLTILHGLAVTAGIGYAGLVWSRWGTCCRMAAALYAICCCKMLDTCSLTLGRYSTDARNPFAYAHTQRDVLRVVERLRNLPSDADHAIRIAMIMEPGNYWPFPWYLPDGDDIVYCDFTRWGADATTDALVRQLLSKQPQALLTLPHQVEMLDPDGRYEWEDVTLRPNMIVKLGMCKTD